MTPSGSIVFHLCPVPSCSLSSAPRGPAPKESSLIPLTVQRLLKHLAVSAWPVPPFGDMVPDQRGPTRPLLHSYPVEKKQLRPQAFTIFSFLGDGVIYSPICWNAWATEGRVILLGVKVLFCNAPEHDSGKLPPGPAPSRSPAMIPRTQNMKSRNQQGW